MEARKRFMVQFQCEICGKCCEWYWIPITHLDMLRLVMYGGYNLKKVIDLMDVQDIENGNSKGLVEIEEGRYYIQLRKEEDVCVFLSERKCLVHKFKPLVCRFYPFVYVVNDDGSINIEVNSEAIGKCPGLKIDSDIIPVDIEKNLKKLARIRLLELELWKTNVNSWNKIMGRKHSLSEFINFSIKKAKKDFMDLVKWKLWIM